MKIAVKKYINGEIIIDKSALKRLDEKTLINPPYNCTIIDVDKEDCQASDFNEDLTFNIDKYNTRKQQENTITYEQLVISKIRQKYTMDQELAILRQRDSKPIEFEEYNQYAEKCKLEAREEIK